MKSISPHPVGNASLLKRLNRSTVLGLLRHQGGLSRKQLTEQTQLDGKTITNITHDLLRLGMIRPIGMVSRGVGRPSEILELHPGYGFALGIDLGASHIAATAVDFTGSIAARAQASIQYGLSPQTVLRRIIELGERIQNELKGRRKRFLGTGVCVPGVVDCEAGIGIWAANLAKWRNIPLRKTLEKFLPRPLFFEESTRCAALGEIFSRHRESMSDFLLLDISLGIGSAIMQNGRLYYGHSGMAGEIGHTTVNPGGELCRCGKRGCLETEASGLAIARKYAKARESLPKKKSHPATAAEVARVALSGDRICETIFTGAARMLGTAAANAVMLLNPAHLILMGGLTRAGDLLLRPFRETLRLELPPEILESLTVEISPLGDDGGPLGAASLVINRIDETPDNVERE